MQDNSDTVIPKHFFELGASSLKNHRLERHDWEDSGISVDRFGPADQKILNDIYAMCMQMTEAWFSSSDRDHDKISGLLDEAVELDLLGKLSELGSDTDRSAHSDVRQILHDVRGGPLTVLASMIDFAAELPQDDELVEKCFSAARDSAKILRLLVSDLDLQGRAIDQASKAHDIDHFADKWKNMRLTHEGHHVFVDLECQFHGNISARCLETSAIDRVTYNLIRNAAKFSTSDRISMYIFVPFTDTTRWVVQNTIDQRQRDFMIESTGGNIGRLYLGGITSGGHGLGLRNAAETIAECYGLDSTEEAVELGYVGAEVDELVARFWFHWPAESSWTPEADC